VTIAKPPIRLGFFTRLLDQAHAAERYRLAIAQIVHAESYGFDSAWIAQHHFHEDEGGLPAPFVFLAQVAARTKRIRLGTGIVTLPLEWRQALSTQPEPGRSCLAGDLQRRRRAARRCRRGWADAVTYAAEAGGPATFVAVRHPEPDD
jgi:hypothetical protein